MTARWELAANAVNTASILLATSNSPHTWWTGIIGCALFGWVFLQSQLYADAYAPLADSAVLTSSVAAQFLLMARRYESWWFWLAANSIAVPVFLMRGLDITAMLYAALWINAVVALVRWRGLVVI